MNGASGEDEDFIDDYEDDFDEPAEVNNCFFSATKPHFFVKHHYDVTFYF